jgi:hypothetical protein
MRSGRIATRWQNRICTAWTAACPWAVDRLDVVYECRDHLISHVERLLGEGISPEAATELAIAQFGTNASVAAGIHREFPRRLPRRPSRWRWQRSTRSVTGARGPRVSAT